MDRIREALSYIPADDRDIWVMCGMAIKAETGDAGREVWESWSMQSDSYDPRSAASVWRSFRYAGKVTIASLFHEAIRNGWTAVDAAMSPVSPEDVAQRRAEAEKKDREEHKKILAQQTAAAHKASDILRKCKADLHPYLDNKGFPEGIGNVWDTGDTRLLVVPMRVGSDLVGCQLIDPDGKKKFLFGQRSSDAEFVIGRGGLQLFCEGYATALSIQAAMAAIKQRHSIHVCFSAHNLTRTAKRCSGAIVIADNDPSGTGEKAAQGFPYWISDVVGEDFNDYWRRVGTFAASQSLRRVLTRR